jgi:hypothetical protein
LKWHELLHKGGEDCQLPPFVTVTLMIIRVNNFASWRTGAGSPWTPSAQSHGWVSPEGRQARWGLRRMDRRKRTAWVLAMRTRRCLQQVDQPAVTPPLAPRSHPGALPRPTARCRYGKALRPEGPLDRPRAQSRCGLCPQPRTGPPG